MCGILPTKCDAAHSKGGLQWRNVFKQQKCFQEIIENRQQKIKKTIKFKKKKKKEKGKKI